jgi:hypothetical protein
MSPLTLIADGQSIFWVYFDLLSNATVWFILVLQLVTAMIPDLVLKVCENIQDGELIKREKRIHRSRVDRARYKIEFNFDTNKKANNRISFF